MKNLFILIFSIFILSCKGATEIKNNSEKTTPSTPQDSTALWVSVDYLNNIDSINSICDCWRKTKYHFLSYDTIKMELFLKSNLMHFGHDSGILLPIKKSDNSFLYDSTLNNWPVSSKQFTIPTNDTLKLLDDEGEILFVKKLYPIREKDKPNNDYYNIGNRFYETSSHLLLKYNKIDQSKSTAILIEPDSLKQLIRDGFVTAHCSDDYYYDGFMIKTDTYRHFQSQFKDNQLIIFELTQGRNKGEKINLDLLPKQVIIIK
tara:strand:- start:103 stop:885 length:783 start_codon:yes stop_codon:yes gene_type:complete